MPKKIRDIENPLPPPPPPADQVAEQVMERLQTAHVNGDALTIADLMKELGGKIPEVGKGGLLVRGLVFWGLNEVLERLIENGKVVSQTSEGLRYYWPSDSSE